MSDEDAFIRAILASACDCDTRLAYADWLEERGDLRAEFLRLLCKAQEREGRVGWDQETQERLRELERMLDPKWVALVRPPRALEPPLFTIVREIAFGALTNVYEAILNPLRQHVALKVLRHRQYAPWFYHAAQLQASLDHARIPALRMVGELPEYLYSVRQLVDGSDLQNDIGRAGRPASEVVRIVTALGEALAYAHGRKIVHGYVHPRHVLQGNDGSTWLIGFGEFPPPSAEFIGHPLHLAPEQFQSRGAVTPLTDVYLLCETACWLMFGRHPFGGYGRSDLLPAKRAGPVLPQRVSRDLEQVLRRGMDPEPRNRYESIGALTAALNGAVSSGQRAARKWWQLWG